jgi:hypothetical protein
MIKELRAEIAEDKQAHEESDQKVPLPQPESPATINNGESEPAKRRLIPQDDQSEPAPTKRRLIPPDTQPPLTLPDN